MNAYRSTHWPMSMTGDARAAGRNAAGRGEVMDARAAGREAAGRGEAMGGVPVCKLAAATSTSSPDAALFAENIGILVSAPAGVRYNGVGSAGLGIGG